MENPPASTVLDRCSLLGLSDKGFIERLALGESSRLNQTAIPGTGIDSQPTPALVFGLSL